MTGEHRWKTLLALLLVLLFAVLLIWFLSIDVGEPLLPAAHSGKVNEGIVGIVDSLLARHDIAVKNVKTWHVEIGGFTRLERQVLVPPSFSSINFHLDLNKSIEHLGARALATERSKEDRVHMHILYHGKTIQSIALVTASVVQEGPGVNR